MARVYHAPVLTYWDVLQAKHACCDIPARRFTFQGSVTLQVLLLYETTKLIFEILLRSVVWIFMLLKFHLQINVHMSVCALQLQALRVWATCVCTCGEQYQKFKLSFSAALMRLCSNIDKRTARAVHINKAKSLFDEWTNWGLCMHITGVSSSLRLLLDTCERKCKTEFLAKLTGQRLST